MNQRLMFSLSIAAGLVVSASLHATDATKPLQPSSVQSPEGAPPPHYRATGVRSSTTLSTVVHCTNLDSAAITVYAYFYQYTGAYVCSTSAPVAVGGTRTLATRDTAAFAEDGLCPAAPAPDVGQGTVAISVVPTGAKFICSAEVVSIADDPPTTLGALDIWPVN